MGQMTASDTKRLIGLDPGLQSTGWGVIEVTGSKLTHLANGSVRSERGLTLGERLVQIEAGLVQVFDCWQPQFAAVEQTFVNRDGAATLKLGQARAISLLVPARRGLPVAEYAPNFIKRSVTGSGHADKNQIAAMLAILLPKADLHDEHAADALAVAITLAHAGDLSGKYDADNGQKRAGGRR